jgi:hypothetical protein
MTTGVFAAAATAYANSVLPHPGRHSTKRGLWIGAARHITSRVTGSMT